MKEITREKRLEVANRYVLGRSYAEIEAETEASHGTIANIVQELENGKLVISGAPSDQISDLRTLSLDLKKKGMQPSQALLGLTLFQRLQDLQITPERLDGWSALLKEFARHGFSRKDFLAAALRLHELEKSQGKTYEVLAEDYVKLGEDVAKLEAEVDSLHQAKDNLAGAVKELESQLQSATKTLNDIGVDVKKETARLQGLNAQVKEATEVNSHLANEAKDLQNRKAKLLTEVDGKEQSLERINDIGISDEDLLRLRAFIERTSKTEGISGDQMRERFFLALTLFEDVTSLEKRCRTEMESLTELIKNQSVLTGEILQLERRRGILEGEIGDSVSACLQEIRDVGASAASQLAQQVHDIREQLDEVLEDTLKAGEAVGEMRQQVRKGEESGKSLDDFVREVGVRVTSNTGGG